MQISDIVQELTVDTAFRERIVHVEQLGARHARYTPIDPPLPPALQKALQAQGITNLYSHQTQALQAAREGLNVGVVTSTASGKTLCYHLPTLERLLDEPRGRALYLFPTKALAQDQLRSLQALMQGLPHLRAAIYDGDTPQNERAGIRAQTNLLLSNPDMLHLAILPHHDRWRRFLSNLKLVVVDEAHVYRGVFGSHVALLLRRLRRLCAYYGSTPQWMLASATIGNPQAHLETLIGAEVEVVDDDGAPHGPRTIMFWNPPLLSAATGARRSTNVETTVLFTELMRAEVRTLVFTKARQMAELLLRYSRQRLGASAHNRIAAYRAGYRAEDRRVIERALFEGELRGVISTNALELGVDIGGLDATISNGYPGTVASQWQQWGRAGRGQEPSLSVLVALDDPMDQYWMQHPDEFFARPHEHARITLDNPYLLTDHLRCTAWEQPITPDDVLRYFGPTAMVVVEELFQRGVLLERQGRAWTPQTDKYPAQEVSIRAISNDSVDLRDTRGTLIERIPLNRAPFEIHRGAVYLHRGESYVVHALDLQAHEATAQQMDVQYYTEARDQTQLRVLAIRQSKRVGGTTAWWGDVEVERMVVGYRRKALGNESVLGDYELELPPQQFQTQAVWWTLPRSFANALRQAGADLAGGLHGAEHAMIALLPLLAMCDRWDIGGVSTPWSPDTGEATVFVYDGVPGGVGISELGFQYLQDWWKITADLLRDCPCESGCPSCVQSPKCGNGNEPLDKAMALGILEMVLDVS